MKLTMDNGKVATIKLVKDCFDDIDVVITKVDGEEVDGGILFTIASGGYFTRIGCVSSSLAADIGLEMDGTKIKENA